VTVALYFGILFLSLAVLSYHAPLTLFVHEINTGYVVDGKETVLDTTWAYQVVDGKVALMHYYSIDYKNVGDVF
jgi:hypothetical protein